MLAQITTSYDRISEIVLILIIMQGAVFALFTQSKGKRVYLV